MKHLTMVALWVIVIMAMSSLALAGEVEFVFGKTEYYAPELVVKSQGSSTPKNFEDLLKGAPPDKEFETVVNYLRPQTEEKRIESLTFIGRDFKGVYKSDGVVGNERALMALRSYYQGIGQKTLNCVSAAVTISSLYSAAGGQAGVAGVIVDGGTHNVSLLKTLKGVSIISFMNSFEGIDAESTISVYEQVNGNVKIYSPVADANGDKIGMIQTPLGRFFSEKLETESFQSFSFGKEIPDGFKVKAGSENSDMSYEVGMKHHFQPWLKCRFLNGLQTVAGQQAGYTAAEIGFSPHFEGMVFDYAMRYGMGSVNFLEAKKSQKFTLMSSHLQIRNETWHGLIVSAGLRTNTQVSDGSLIESISYSRAESGLTYSGKIAESEFFVGINGEFTNAGNFRDEKFSFMYDSQFGNFSPTYLVGMSTGVGDGIASIDASYKVDNLNTVLETHAKWESAGWKLGTGYKKTDQVNWMGYSDSDRWEANVACKIDKRTWLKASGSLEDIKTQGEFSSFQGGVQIDF